MTMRPDGKLLVASETHGDVLELSVVEPRTGRLVTTFEVPGGRDDLRAITWPADCGNPSPGGRAPLIVEATLDRDLVCPGEPVRVDVAAVHPEGAPNPVHVDVNGTAGNSVVLQFRGPAGVRYVQVTATTFEGHIDTRTLTVDVVECEPGEAYPRVYARPSPFHELVVDFQVANTEELGDGQTYEWDFGDGQLAETDVPHAAHPYSERDLARDAIFTTFEARLTVHAQGEPDRTVPKTITLWNAYALAKRRGVIQPPVHQGDRMRQGASNWVASFELTNLEDEYVRFTTRRDEKQFCDRERVPEFQPARNVSIALRAQELRQIVVVRPFGELPEEVCGLGVHYEGSTDSGMPSRASAYFTLRDAEVVPETDPAMLEALNRVIAEGLVADPDRVTHEELYTLALEGKLEYPFRAPPGLVIHQQNGEPCSPDDEPPDGWVCSATEGADVVPAFLANARKGDLILSTACGTVSQMLSRVTPPQVYEHEGIMTRNHDQISHSTSSEDRLAAHVVPLPWPHISPSVMQFGWPGSLHQSVEEAFLGAWVDDFGGTRYRINSFNDDPARCGRDGALLTPRVLWGDPDDVATYEQLRSAADFADGTTAHYRYFGYTDASIAEDEPVGGEGIATMSSSFIWQAMRQAEVVLEGGNLEREDFLGADIYESVLDGLYYYWQFERQAAAEFLWAHTANQVAEAWEGEHFAAFGNIANQTVNCFAFDSCGEGAAHPNANLWASGVGDGRTVSPEDFRFWDPYPNEEVAILRSGELRRRYELMPEEGIGSIRGVVRLDGAPVDGARVTISTDPLQEEDSDDDGAFFFEQVPAGGNTVVTACKPVQPEGSRLELLYCGETELRVRDGLEHQIFVDLEPPPENRRFLSVDAVGTLEDDEAWDADETEDWDFFGGLSVWPDALEARHTWRSPCTGDEVRATLEVTATLNPTDEVTVNVVATARLYEGTTCGTNEREEIEWYQVMLGPDEHVDHDFSLENEPDISGDGDKLDLHVTFWNEQQP
jgi:hypothetical protein